MIPACLWMLTVTYSQAMLWADSRVFAVMRPGELTPTHPRTWPQQPTNPCIQLKSMWVGLTTNFARWEVPVNLGSHCSVGGTSNPPLYLYPPTLMVILSWPPTVLLEGWTCSNTCHGQSDDLEVPGLIQLASSSVHYITCSTDLTHWW